MKSREWLKNERNSNMFLFYDKLTEAATAAATATVAPKAAATPSLLLQFQ